MARRRRTLEERIAAAEGQLEALRVKQRLTRKESFEERMPAIVARWQRRNQREAQCKAAWGRLSVANKVKHKRRVLAKVIAEWEARDAGQSSLPFHVRIRLDESHYWQQRQCLEADIQELEGAPPEQLVKLRWAADESFRQGKLVSADEYDKAHAPPPVPATAPAAKDQAQKVRDWRPKPPERDVLKDYRGDPRRVHRWLEPEFV